MLNNIVYAIGLPHRSYLRGGSLFDKKTISNENGNLVTKDDGTEEKERAGNLCKEVNKVIRKNLSRKDKEILTVPYDPPKKASPRKSVDIEDYLTKEPKAITAEKAAPESDIFELSSIKEKIQQIAGSIGNFVFNGYDVHQAKPFDIDKFIKFIENLDTFKLEYNSDWQKFTKDLSSDTTSKAYQLLIDYLKPFYQSSIYRLPGQHIYIRKIIPGLIKKKIEERASIDAPIRIKLTTLGGGHDPVSLGATLLEAVEEGLEDYPGLKLNKNVFVEITDLELNPKIQDMTKKWLNSSPDFAPIMLGIKETVENHENFKAIEKYKTLLKEIIDFKSGSIANKAVLRDILKDNQDFITCNLVLYQLDETHQKDFIDLIGTEASENTTFIFYFQYPSTVELFNKYFHIRAVQAHTDPFYKTYIMTKGLREKAASFLAEEFFEEIDLEGPGDKITPGILFEQKILQYPAKKEKEFYLEIYNKNPNLAGAILASLGYSNMTSSFERIIRSDYNEPYLWDVINKAITTMKHPKTKVRCLKNDYLIDVNDRSFIYTYNELSLNKQNEGTLLKNLLPESTAFIIDNLFSYWASGEGYESDSFIEDKRDLYLDITTETPKIVEFLSPETKEWLGIKNQKTTYVSSSAGAKKSTFAKTTINIENRKSDKYTMSAVDPGNIKLIRELLSPDYEAQTYAWKDKNYTSDINDIIEGSKILLSINDKNTKDAMGYILYTPEDKNSIYLDRAFIAPEYRRNSICHSAINDLQDIFDTIKAWVSPDDDNIEENLQQMFTEAGFIKYHEDSKEFVWRNPNQSMQLPSDVSIKIDKVDKDEEGLIEKILSIDPKITSGIDYMSPFEEKTTYEEIIKGEKKILYVSDLASSEIMGYLLYNTKNDNEIDIERVFVSEGYRRQGMFRLLIEGSMNRFDKISYFISPDESPDEDMIKQKLEKTLKELRFKPMSGQYVWEKPQRSLKKSNKTALLANKTVEKTVQPKKDPHSGQDPVLEKRKADFIEKIQTTIKKNSINNIKAAHVDTLALSMGYVDKNSFMSVAHYAGLGKHDLQKIGVIFSEQKILTAEEKRKNFINKIRSEFDKLGLKEGEKMHVDKLAEALNYKTPVSFVISADSAGLTKDMLIDMGVEGLKVSKKISPRRIISIEEVNRKYHKGRFNDIADIVKGLNLIAPELKHGKIQYNTIEDIENNIDEVVTSIFEHTVRSENKRIMHNTMHYMEIGDPDEKLTALNNIMHDIETMKETIRNYMLNVTDKRLVPIIARMPDYAFPDMREDEVWGKDSRIEDDIMSRGPELIDNIKKNILSKGTMVLQQIDTINKAKDVLVEKNKETIKILSSTDNKTPFSNHRNLFPVIFDGRSSFSENNPFIIEDVNSFYYERIIDRVLLDRIPVVLVDITNKECLAKLKEYFDYKAFIVNIHDLAEDKTLETYMYFDEFFERHQDGTLFDKANYDPEFLSTLRSHLDNT
ncbi:MAG: hypothetical protein ABIG92_03045 [Candidatus Omnitrophota bacterium]